ncbi:deoxyribonuclease HsdR [Virgibacillus profundi]|uniref:Type I restriction enzyme endonuclease subunit n=1 Tax=Virgibacillus profundi TaxID=2024555 RepID=A0A2A2I7T9_9BACI|nr:HsdR family type I site-specific deoxyribonuclease [Virgibacillus profundi]PAV27789.1 deoxyribonuclease HsdR [Virgibacillus profundi]PXY52011.1 type I restriction endonuclease subunit R [Virgibacillus profundi]
MSNGRKNAAEKAFQDKFVNKLQQYKWNAPDFLDGNKQKVTVQDLVNHWRKELNRMNADVLETVPLTDNEFAQVMNKVSRIDNSYEAAKILAMEQSTGKIDGIYRDSHPDVTREQITLTIFKKAQVRGGDSSYKIAREVESPNGNRFDIVLLINGLPLINIEQKRTDKTLEEAYNQFKRYYADGEYVNNFMAFSQMMVMTSEIATRYFATPKSIQAFNPSFVFHWANKDNQAINHWEEVIGHFLMIPMAHQMVGDYLVIDEAKEEENRKHMLLRSYQVHALQAVEGAALGWDNEDKVPHGGFVWHTTGSGKTITSFKTALFLSTRAGFDNVVFLVDRRELDSRTSDNFKSYAQYESVTVDDTAHTYQLRKLLSAASTGIVVTTTFKLNNLVKDLVEAKDESLANKKIVFIIDEAHRTTMGDMMVTIRNYFRKNGLFYGFTGTPLFDENNITGMINEKSELIDTTEKLFGPELHTYTIDEAIADKNVLGFHVDYINTGEFESYDTLREQIVEYKLAEQPDAPKRKLERQVYELSELEVEKEAKKRKILFYHDETHIPRVVEEILNNWEYQSQQKLFNAILTVKFKHRVIAYYEEFKKQLAERDDIAINVAMTFSFGTDADTEPTDPELIKTMFKDYAVFTGIEYAYGDKRRGEDAYYEDVVERATRGGSGRNPKNIDLVIVADQLLTGYDSKFINTLYVDRSLALQGLIQAYSRTNRIYGKEKEFGSIVNFQYPRTTEQTVNDALILYGSGGKSSKAIVEPYPIAVDEFVKSSQDVIEILQDPTAWQALEKDEEAKENFVKAFKMANGQLNTIQQYYEFAWVDEAFGITEHEWMRYVGAYRNVTRDDNPDDDPEDLPVLPLGEAKLAGTQKIDAYYIIQLIGDKATSTDGKQTVDGETLRIVYQHIEELSNLGDFEQAELLKQFVEKELKPGNVSSDVNFDEAYEEWKRSKLRKEIYQISAKWGIDEVIFEKSVESYSIANPKEIPYIDDITRTVNYDSIKHQKTSNQLEHNMELLKVLPEIVPKLKRKFK